MNETAIETERVTETDILAIDPIMMNLLKEIARLTDQHASSIVEESLFEHIDTIFKQIEGITPGLVKQLKEDYDFMALKAVQIENSLIRVDTIRLRVPRKTRGV